MRSIEDQARYLAQENQEAYSELWGTLWFPDTTEIRILIITGESAPYEGDLINPFYFKPAPDFGLTAWTAVTLIRPEEVGKLRLPDGWPDWSAAKRL